MKKRLIQITNLLLLLNISSLTVAMFNKKYPKIELTKDTITTFTRDQITPETNFFFAKKEAPINIAFIYRNPQHPSGYILRHVYTPYSSNNAIKLSEYYFDTQMEAQDTLLMYLLNPLDAPYNPVSSAPQRANSSAPTTQTSPQLSPRQGFLIAKELSDA